MSAYRNYAWNAPSQPGYTCPKIDKVIKSIKDAISAIEDAVSELEELEDQLEEIRTANSELRAHGDHWENASKELAEEVDALSRRVEDLEHANT